MEWCSATWDLFYSHREQAPSSILGNSLNLSRSQYAVFYLGAKLIAFLLMLADLFVTYNLFQTQRLAGATSGPGRAFGANLFRNRQGLFISTGAFRKLPR